MEYQPGLTKYYDLPAIQTGQMDSLDDSVAMTTGIEEPPVHFSTQTIFATVFNSVIFLVGILANAFVVFLILYLSKVKNVTNIYVLNLAVADLMFLLWLPFVIMRSHIGQWVWGMATCKLFFICTSVNQFGSVAFLTCLSFDRYLAVCHPIKARDIRSPPIATAIATVCWIIVAALMTPVYLYSSIANVIINDELDSEIQCLLLWPNGDGAIWSRKTFTIYSGALGYFLPLLVIWTLYGITLSRLKHRPSSLKSVTKARKRRYRKVTIMVLMVVVSYTICWGPFWAVQFLIELLDEDTLAEYASVLQNVSIGAYCVQSLNSVLNPILYCLATGAYGKALVSVLKKQQKLRRAAKYRVVRMLLPNLLVAELVATPNLTVGTKLLRGGNNESKIEGFFEDEAYATAASSSDTKLC